MDVGEAITIEDESAEVYDDKLFKDRKPKRGTKLNKRAIIKLFIRGK